MTNKEEKPSTDGDHNFDIVMEKVGYLGKFQMRFNYVFNLCLVFLAAMPYLNMILALAVPDHWCHVPGRENTNFSMEEWKNITLPREYGIKGQETVSKCKMFNVTNSIMLDLQNLDQKYDIVECQYGWDYDRTWYAETAPSEANWVCDKELSVSNAFAFGRIGDVVGTLVFGQLGDIVGRRPVLYITLVILIVGRTLSAFTVHNYPLFLFATLLGSLTSNAVFQAPMIIAMEICSVHRRAYITMLQSIGWTAALCAMPLIFWVLGHWYWFILVTTLPCVIFCFSYKLMVESPRWLAAQGKTAKSIRQLERIAKVNGTTVPSDAMITLRKKTESSEKVFGAMSLFSNWRLTKNTLLMINCWVNGSLIYYVIMLNINSLGGNPFMNYFWQGLAELPAYIVACYCCDKYGRRWTQVIPYLLVAIECAVMAFLIADPDIDHIISALAVLIKFTISMVFYSGSLQTLEIYPTNVRQSALSLCCFSANAIGILGPYIVYLGTSFDARYPSIVLTILAISGALSAAFLPETLHQKLPDSISDAYEFGADQKFWSLPKKPKTDIEL